MKYSRTLLFLTALLLSACGGGGQQTSLFHSEEHSSSSTSSVTSSSTSSATSSSTSSEHSHSTSSETSSVSESSSEEHHFSPDWSSDDEYHWHACIDEGYEDLKSDYERHHYELVKQYEPTFEDEGLNIYRCSVCEHILEEIVPVKEHNYSDYYEYDEENHIQYCTDEGYEYLYKLSPHDYDVVVVEEPTYELDGLAIYTCKYCGYYYRQSLPKKEHNYGDWEFYTPYDHIRYCTDEGYGTWYQTQAHDMHEEVIEPTFEEGGHTHHWCSVCGWNYDDTYTYPKQHNYAKVFSYDETYHWRACIDEGYEDLFTDKAEHGTYGYFDVWDEEPTNDAPGKAHLECNQCGYTFKTDVMVDQFTQGMIFSLIDEGKAYAITGTTYLFNEESYIPETYNNLPVTEIGDRAFKGKSLYSFTIPTNVTKIGDEAFMNCPLEEFHMGDNVIHIGKNAFMNTNLTSIDLSSKLQTIDDSAFENTKIASFDLPDSLHTIGERAFANTPISEITLPDNVIETGFAVFSGCSNLTKISLPYFGKTKDIASGNNSIDTILGHYFGGNSYNNSTKFTQYYGIIDHSTVYFDTYIPNGLTDIIIRGGSIVPDNALYGITLIKNIYLGKSISSFGSFAFRDMSGLKNVYYEGDITDWAGIDTTGANAYGSSPFVNNKNLLAFYLENENGEYSYNGKNFTMPHEVVVDFCEKIPSFFLTGLLQITSVTISNGVTSVGDFAFNSCSNLKILIFPDSVTYMGSNVFTQCENIETLRLSANANPAYRGQFGGLKNLKTLYIPSIASGTEMLGDFFDNGDGTKVYQYPFDNNTAYTRYIPTNLKDITVASGAIHNGFFSGCSMVEKVTFGKEISSYGKNMFRANIGIKELVFEQYPFDENSEAEDTSYSHAGIDRFLLGKLLSRIGFSGGQERLQLFAPADRKHLPESQWYVMYEDSTKNICRCYVPESLAKIEVKSGFVGPYALINLDPVQMVTFGKDVTLSRYSCADLDNLRIINLEAGIQFKEDFGLVFDQCPNIETINFKGTEEQFLAIKDKLGITCSYTINYIQ